MKKILLGVGIVLVAGLTYGFYAAAPIVSGGSGYAAKNLCSGYYLSHFDAEITHKQALIGASDVLANIEWDHDKKAKSFTARLYGLSPRTAVFDEGTGCTLLAEGNAVLDRDLKLVASVTLDPIVPWPHGRGEATSSDAFQSLLDQAFAEADPVSARNTKAALIIHKGELLAERYADGVKADTPLLGGSMSKSITALLTGLLVGDGKLDVAAPADVPVWHNNVDDPRAGITLDQLMRMSSGLKFDETYATGSDVSHMLSVEPDAAAFAASLSLAHAPDTHWSYSSGTSNIISGIIKRTLGGSLQSHYDYAQNRLFKPLGINTATIETDSDGTFIGSSYTYLSARDWGRLGQFVLQDGVWKDERLLPEGWVDYVSRPTHTNSLNSYGAQFWLNADPDDASIERTWPRLPSDAFMMSGFQGQFVMMVPSKDLVVVRLGFTSRENHGLQDLVAGVIKQLEG